MLTLYLVRHGEAEGNAKNMLMGQSDPALTEAGKKDAKKLGEKLRSVEFDKIYSSDLRRAFETASIIYSVLNSTPDLEKTEELCEIDLGDCCGMESERFSEKYPGSKDDVDFCFPNGESYKGFFSRIKYFLNMIAGEHDHENVLIVAHEGVIKAIEYHFGCFEFCDHAKIKIPYDYVGRFMIDRGILCKKEIYKN